MATSQRTDTVETGASYIPQAPATAPPPFAERLLAPTGVRINGSRPWDIRVHDARVYSEALAARLPRPRRGLHGGRVGQRAAG